MKVIKGENVIYTFKTEMDPVEKINAGEKVKFETNDCWFQQIYSENQVIKQINYDILNPATGPVFVEGAEPGDILKVKVVSIDVAKQGSSVAVPNEGVLGERIKSTIVKIIKIEDNHAVFNDLRIPIDPMIGVIGVAPSKEDGDCKTNTPWKHGGNMDTTDIRQGSTLYFPVSQKGALLALGDCHAIMGDGEICFTGLEIPAEVVLEVDVIKNKTIVWPIVETKDHIMIIASGEDLEEAVKFATNEAVDYLKESLNLTFEEAYVLTSMAVDLKISQVVDPKLTVRAAIPKNILSMDKLIDNLPSKVK